MTVEQGVPARRGAVTGDGSARYRTIVPRVDQGRLACGSTNKGLHLMTYRTAPAPARPVSRMLAAIAAIFAKPLLQSALLAIALAVAAGPYALAQQSDPAPAAPKPKPAKKPAKPATPEAAPPAAQQMPPVQPQPGQAQQQGQGGQQQGGVGSAGAGGSGDYRKKARERSDSGPRSG